MKPHEYNPNSNYSDDKFVFIGTTKTTANSNILYPTTGYAGASGDPDLPVLESGRNLHRSVVPPNPCTREEWDVYINSFDARNADGSVMNAT